MNRAELIAQITGFDTEFFAPGLENNNRLNQMPDSALYNLALILQAASDKRNAVILPPHPESLFDRNDLSVIVRIDKNGKMILDQWGVPEYDGIVYKAEGTVCGGKLGLEQVKFYPTRKKSSLKLIGGNTLQIQSQTVINGYETTASYLRAPAGKLKFDHGLVNLRRLSGSFSHEPFDNNELTIPAVGPATYRFNGNWKKKAEIQADGSGSIEVKPFPCQNQLSVKRTTAGTQIRFDVTQSKMHSGQELEKFDAKTTFSFFVFALALKPETPDSGTIQIDLATIEAGQISDLDDLAIALLALAPAEIIE